MISATRTHQICCGHRVYGHESKCKFLHGHNYTFEMTVSCEELDSVGRVMDFSVIKSKLCIWLEVNWDHKKLIYDDDPILNLLLGLSPVLDKSIVAVPFNPTAENIAKYFVEQVGPEQLYKTGCVLTSVRLWETDKCSATYSK